MSNKIENLVKIMARLRGKNGCPWDRQQTHRSLIKYLREEAKEVEKAIRRNDFSNLREELGDLLLQIVFHAQLAQEKGIFHMDDVIEGICSKLVRRHPHVFGKAKLRTARQVVLQWKQLKRMEKSQKRHER